MAFAHCIRPPPSTVKALHPQYLHVARHRLSCTTSSTTSLLRCRASIESSGGSRTQLQAISVSPVKDVKVHQHAPAQMQEWIYEIKGMFAKMTFGEISVSPYDTAWVAMVPSLDGSNSPQFPQCLNWIIKNQLMDGSWGDKDLFLAYDRVSSTLACLVALKTWNIGEAHIQRGVDFINQNIRKIEEEADDYMPTAFEVTFPTMMEDAENLGIDLPYNLPLVDKLRKARNEKFKRIPMEVLYNFPSTLLHSLEGIHRLVDWEEILKLQTKNGSFLFSPASTACALKYTGNSKCLEYLNSVLAKYIDAVPSVYPVDLFEHLWMVDRLERLGISRYFTKEIKKCLDYVYKYWTSKGIAWAKESNVFDVDDTAMGFRLLRLHGYNVSPEVFHQFRNHKEFFCFEGQTSQAISGMHNLYRASLVMLPNEDILQDIKIFTRSFLIDKQQHNKIEDKWVISKGLKGEVLYSLNNPWHQSLPRIEARDFIHNYGVDDAWIAKSLYRMQYINNEVFLKLAKADYNACQLYHQKELAQVLKWNEQCQFDKLAFARQKAKQCFFSVAATLFEPEYSLARKVWAMCSILVTVLDDFFDVKCSLDELESFVHAVNCWDPTQTKGFSKEMIILFMGLYNTINNISQEAHIVQGRDISDHLRGMVVNTIGSMYIEAKWRLLNYCPSLEEYMLNAKNSIAIELILQPTLFFLGEKISKEDFEHKDYSFMLDPVNTIGRINNDIQGFERENEQGKWSCVEIFLKENPQATKVEAIQHFKLLIDDAMKILLKEYLRDTNIPKQCKEAHLNMAKVLNLFYSKGDGHTLATLTSHDVKNTLYIPIS